MTSKGLTRLSWSDFYIEQFEQDINGNILYFQVYDGRNGFWVDAETLQGVHYSDIDSHRGDFNPHSTLSMKNFLMQITPERVSLLKKLSEYGRYPYAFQDSSGRCLEERKRTSKDGIIWDKSICLRRCIFWNSHDEQFYRWNPDKYRYTHWVPEQANDIQAKNWSQLRAW